MTNRNRLALETSLYLLQHADNPVDWYPWGDEALDKARVEDLGKPPLALATRVELRDVRLGGSVVATRCTSVAGRVHDAMAVTLATQ